MNSDITYEDRVCLFLDIMGFTEHVNDTIQGESLNLTKITEISKLLTDLPIGVEKFGFKGTNRQITQFSDSIVISFPLTDRNAFVKLIDELMLVTINLINKEYLVRGGISYGKLYHNEKIVFGPAMNTAYELESKIAIYPRIIFDKELVEELINYGGIEQRFNEKEDFKSENRWKEDFDGKYYLNYFGGAQPYIEDDKIYLEYIMNLRKFIVKALKNRKSQTVLVKYGWLKTKFNLMIDEFEFSEKSRIKLLIK